MIVITLTDCPPSLRGDLSQWLQEIDTGVYVGLASARVRDALWDRICDNAKSGRAVMVYRAENEQRMDFRIHNTNWVPIDFDGLKLVMRPQISKSSKAVEGSKTGFSKAAIRRKAHSSHQRGNETSKWPDTYTVIQMEMPVPDDRNAGFVCFHAIHIESAQVKDTFSIELPLELQSEQQVGSSLEQKEARVVFKTKLSRLLTFVSANTIVTHGADLVYRYLRDACEINKLPLFSNPCIDTYDLSKKYITNADEFSLESLASQLGLSVTIEQGDVRTCFQIHMLYMKLMEFSHA